MRGKKQSESYPNIAVSMDVCNGLGLVIDTDSMSARTAVLTIGVSDDEFGRSLAIADSSLGLMYMIPLEYIEDQLGGLTCLK